MCTAAVRDWFLKRCPPGLKWLFSRTPHFEPSFPFTKVRLEALSDGVFSVSLTILVVDPRIIQDFEKFSKGEYLDLIVTMFSFYY
jgi:hypothetical protein